MIAPDVHLGAGVTIEDECFIGHHVVFVNDRYPAAVAVEAV
jgi:acetyltransferase-like isoleucine patch superfamily enzyme